MEYYLDTKGYECPIPVLKTAKRIKKLKKNVTLEIIKQNSELSDLPLIKQSRLSVMPIDSKSWKIICKLGKI